MLRNKDPYFQGDRLSDSSLIVSQPLSVIFLNRGRFPLIVTTAIACLRQPSMSHPRAGMPASTWRVNAGRGLIHSGTGHLCQQYLAELVSAMPTASLWYSATFFRALISVYSVSRQAPRAPPREQVERQRRRLSRPAERITPIAAVWGAMGSAWAALTGQTTRRNGLEGSRLADGMRCHRMGENGALLDDGNRFYRSKLSRMDTPSGCGSNYSPGDRRGDDAPSGSAVPAGRRRKAGG